MPTVTDRVVRYDASDPEDRRLLIENGAIWEAGPKAQQAAIQDLIEGRVPMNDNVPQEVADYILTKRGELG